MMCRQQLADLKITQRVCPPGYEFLAAMPILECHVRRTLDMLDARMPDRALHGLQFMLYSVEGLLYVN